MLFSYRGDRKVAARIKFEERMNRQRALRLLFSLVLAGALVLLGHSALAAPGETRFGHEQGIVAPPTENITVITTDSNSWLGRADGGTRANAEIVALAPDGTVLYYNDSHTRYWDVDPVDGSPMTVEYVYADHVYASDCGDDVCTENGIERLNLSTGEVTSVFSRVTPGKHSTRWHDVDRLSETRLLVADIAQDRVFEVDQETGIVTWAWSAQSAFSVRNSGGPYPSDWTHMNDVEHLEDGIVMASVRNHDQVVFIDPEHGLLENWTLGADEQYETLYEQHNPDYIPREQGGPAVLVSDSENNRVVEYQREGGEWTRSWAWGSGRLSWPRDADRLPNGHTLITDSNGDRVLEVATNGTVVWSVDIAFPYEAERLETGDESTNGPSASKADLRSRGRTTVGITVKEDPSRVSLFGKLESQLTGRIQNAFRYILPAWVGLPELLAGFAAVVTGIIWIVTEWKWSTWSATFQWPITLTRNK